MKHTQKEGGKLLVGLSLETSTFLPKLSLFQWKWLAEIAEILSKISFTICVFLPTKHLHTQCQFNTSIYLHAWWHIPNALAAILINQPSENNMSKIFTLCKSVKCLAHIGNYLLLSLIISSTHLALWLNQEELTGNLPFPARCPIQAVSFNEQPFSAHRCTWQTQGLLATHAGESHQ